MAKRESKAEKLGLVSVEYRIRYAAAQAHDHPALILKRKNWYTPIRIDFQRHRLDYKDAMTMYGYSDIMEYRRACGQSSHPLWDVGEGPYSLTYAPSMNHLRFDGYDGELEFLADLKKELAKAKVDNLSPDPMTAMTQKLMRLGVEVEFKYIGPGADFDSPYALPDQYRGHAERWANSAEACRIVAEEEMKKAEKLAEGSISAG